jgi:hypothetical protein
MKHRIHRCQHWDIQNGTSVSAMNEGMPDVAKAQNKENKRT